MYAIVTHSPSSHTCEPVACWGRILPLLRTMLLALKDDGEMSVSFAKRVLLLYSRRLQFERIAGVVGLYEYGLGPTVATTF